LIPLTVVLAEFPALSTAVPVELRPDPSVESVTGEVHVETPDVASPQVYVTVTFELFHPLAFAAGVAAPVMVGGVLSIFRVCVEFTDAFPATSVDECATECVALSPLTVNDAGAAPVVDEPPSTDRVAVATPLPPIMWNARRRSPRYDADAR